MRTVVIIVLVSSLSVLSIVFYSSNFIGSVFASNSIKRAKQNDGVGALSRMSIAIKLSPGVSTYPRLRSEYLLALIEADPTTKEAYEPIIAQDLERAINLNPWYHRHYIKAAEAASQLDQPEQSIKLYNRALQLVPNSSRLHDRLAAILIDNGQSELAIGYIDNAIKLTQDSDWSYRSYYLAGIAFENMQQVENAAQAVLMSLKKSPNSSLCPLAIEYLQKRIVDFESVYHDAEKCTNYQNYEPSSSTQKVTP